MGFEAVTHWRFIP